jgi:sulfur-carrier protein
MPRLIFTPQLRRFTEVPEVKSSASELRAALDDAFAGNPRLRGYILDEQGHLRPNVVIFIDGQRIQSTRLLNDVLLPTSQIYILQALSGG